MINFVNMLEKNAFHWFFEGQLPKKSIPSIRKKFKEFLLDWYEDDLTNTDELVEEFSALLPKVPH